MIAEKYFSCNQLVKIHTMTATQSITVSHIMIQSFHKNDTKIWFHQPQVSLWIREITSQQIKYLYVVETLLEDIENGFYKIFFLPIPYDTLKAGILKRIGNSERNSSLRLFRSQLLQSVQYLIAERSIDGIILKSIR